MTFITEKVLIAISDRNMFEVVMIPLHKLSYYDFIKVLS